MPYRMPGNPPVISEDVLAARFDLILLACKAYDLDGAMASFTPAVGPDTAILPSIWGQCPASRT
jgi:2-dehydropantoate 2-reductase